MKINIKTYRLELFLEKLAKVNKKLAELGQKVEIINTRYWAETISEEFGNYEENWLEIEISEPSLLGIEGTTYIGTVSKKSGTKQVFNLYPEKYYLHAETERCDHCATKRARIKYFFFEKDGKLFSIGSACSKLYFGIDLGSMLGIYQKFVEDVSSEEIFCKVPYDGTPLNFVIATTHFVGTKKNAGRWVSTKEDDSSTQMLKEIFFCKGKGKLYQEYSSFINKITRGKMCEIIEDVRKKIQEKYYDLVPANDFESNVKNALFEADIKMLRSYVFNIGVVAYAVHQLLFPPVKSNGWVGKEGDEITLDVSVDKVFDIHNRYDRNKKNVSIKMLDENGNRLETFYSGKDIAVFTILASSKKVVTIKAKVKKLAEYKENKTTQITRVKIKT